MEAVHNRASNLSPSLKGQHDRDYGMALFVELALERELISIPGRDHSFPQSSSTPNHALQRTAPRVTVAADSYLGVFPPSHLLL